MIIRTLKAWYQRRTRGFADSDLWNLDSEIFEFAAPRIRRMAETTHSHPSSYEFKYADEMYDAGDWEKYHKLTDDQIAEVNDAASCSWKRDLIKMARAMEIWNEHGGIYVFQNEDGQWVSDEKREAELQKEFEEGWELFKTHFFNLWI